MSPSTSTVVEALLMMVLQWKKINRLASECVCVLFCARKRKPSQSNNCLAAHRRAVPTANRRAHPNTYKNYWLPSAIVNTDGAYNWFVGILTLFFFSSLPHPFSLSITSIACVYHAIFAFNVQNWNGMKLAQFASLSQSIRIVHLSHVKRKSIRHPSDWREMKLQSHVALANAIYVNFVPTTTSFNFMSDY